ncbi:3-hydroxyacyl-CoA dehydrogenase NAD-binding domain-containing protein [Chitinimonas taiwanensis]|uniref:3-hydroxyacyl-CoA dehydrogenase / enoyl-CoA hydratase / 3-hydroxybutyryl-CoA epimerase n=1 Tax=Chitinimonas taiwanensis DSM 18899 TaxID=1121279 RepID=A0A1K2HI86_9NEIS|nr:3-hydroxyacyl-CoA dehydrogenase NAD-binding domain-containing protein [Chitinimonas taiwanensis]SFZ76435.1 3-hydroxyacyl-CoA dehydrogenase / enoyl-CoA hydratase / 3-hydroxybutyryl-CoA epimerase [Chitinimonas taiwanensis DSM 18899]
MSIDFQMDAQGVVTLSLDAPGQTINTMDAAFRASIAAVADRLEAERAQLRGVIIVSRKKTFFAGGDLDELRSIPADGAEAFFQMVETMKRHMRRIETLGVPVVACLNGAALGGGWEVALIAHHRIALDKDKRQFGLPEVSWGLLPGAGGISKMVRLLGLQAAFPYILESQQFSAREGMAAGLIHALAQDEADMLAQAQAYIAAHPASRQPWDEDGYKLPGGAPNHPKVAQMLSVAPAALYEKTRGNYPAPERALAAMVEGAQVDFSTALRIESRYFTELCVGQVAKNMIGTLFFSMNEIKAGASRPAGFDKCTVQKIGVLGAGMMGAGIAWAAASRGVRVVLKDVDLSAAERGKAYSAKLLAKQVEKGRKTQAEADAVLARIQTTASLPELAGCEIVIEAVFENRELKAQVTREVEAVLGAEALFASNTSTLPISELAAASQRPANFIGLHFFSPVDKMQLVEIIRGQRTSPASLARAYDFVQQIGKTPIVVNDGRGFFTSRVFGSYVNEGMAMLGEGIPPAMIEAAGLQAGMPVGPLAVTDEVSLSLCAHIAAEARAALGSAYLAHPADAVLARMLDEFGRQGRAAGGGFYDYPEGAKKQLWPGLAAFAQAGKALPAMQELIDRLLFVQALDTARCFDEGVLESERDANVGALLGIGFPAWTGGTAQFLKQYGVAKAIARAEQLAAQHGARFAVPNWLRQQA